MPASMHNTAADLLAKTVVELRKQAGMNQRDLATALGREQNYVARIETGQRRLDLIEWVQLLRVLRVDPQHEIVQILRQVLPLVAKVKPKKS
jgi:transcriptional regulator with XRE-family HTH domain